MPHPPSSRLWSPRNLSGEPALHIPFWTGRIGGGVEQPEARALLGLDLPVIAETRAPAWIVQPPFRRKPLRPSCAGGSQPLAAPGEEGRRLAGAAPVLQGRAIRVSGHSALPVL